jgi:hypothetical protein
MWFGKTDFVFKSLDGFQKIQRNTPLTLMHFLIALKPGFNPNIGKTREKLCFFVPAESLILDYIKQQDSEGYDRITTKVASRWSK